MKNELFADTVVICHHEELFVFAWQFEKLTKGDEKSLANLL